MRNSWEAGAQPKAFLDSRHFFELSVALEQQAQNPDCSFFFVHKQLFASYSVKTPITNVNLGGLHPAPAVLVLH